MSDAGLSASRRLPLALLVAASIFGALLAASAGLWAYYGSAVFYEMILAGIAACF